MYYTYVLKCTNKDGRESFYTGSTENLKERLIAHKSKSTFTTKKFDKIELVYFEACLNKTDSVLREKQLKTGFGRGYLKRRIKNYLNSSRE